ncbi:MAG: hypothetical protein VYA80_01555 [Pseudomonadota bacterium]|nr:hypothetical protein [Pseudomonadota bacterium]
MNRLQQFCFIVFMLTSKLTVASIGPNDAEVIRLVEFGLYDQELCTTAQRIILNASADDYETLTLKAKGGTFVAEQMSANGQEKTVTVAALLESVKFGRETIAVSMACKMVNQRRVNDVLKLKLEQPSGTCKDVNSLTYQIALNGLTVRQRERYLSKGTSLEFIDDAYASAGGAWLASVVSDYISPEKIDGKLIRMIVQASSVQVAWPESGGDWFEGTNHCKLITLAAMTRWMKKGSFDGSTEMFPRPKPKCIEPDSRTSKSGSCLQYFGPAGAQFCQDYSGTDWTETTAREDCDIRHSTLDAWNAKSGSYDGGGGIFSSDSCAERNVISEAIASPVNQAESAYQGTCVFRCNTPDESLWHQISPMAFDPDGTGMQRTCDLYLKVDW